MNLSRTILLYRCLQAVRHSLRLVRFFFSVFLQVLHILCQNDYFLKLFCVKSFVLKAADTLQPSFKYHLQRIDRLAVMIIVTSRVEWWTWFRLSMFVVVMFFDILAIVCCVKDRHFIDKLQHHHPMPIAIYQLRHLTLRLAASVSSSSLANAKMSTIAMIGEKAMSTFAPSQI